MVKKSRLVLPGHSSKCILLNCGFFPRFGAHPPYFALTWPVGAERGGYLLIYCIVSSFCRQANSMVKKSRLEELSCGWRCLRVVVVSCGKSIVYFLLSSSTICNV
jgi:hypothetical protein